MEVSRRRPDVEARLRRSADVIHRGDCGGCRRTRASCTWVRAKRTSAGTLRRATASTGRSMAGVPGRTCGCRAVRSARLPCTRPTPTSRSRRCSGTRSGPTRSAACTARVTAGAAGSACSRKTPIPARRMSRSIRRTRTSCSRACGRRAAGLGSSSAADRAAGSTCHATAATRGRRSRARDSPKGHGEKSVSPLRRPTAVACMR